MGSLFLLMSSLLLTIFLVAGIFTFQAPGLRSYSMRVTASYLYAGLAAVACKYAVRVR